MKNKRLVMKSLFGYLAAAFSVIVMASIPNSATAGSPCLGFGFSGGGISIAGSTGGCGLGSGGIGSSLCNIVSWFTVGGIGAAVASMAVIFMGIAAFFGKVTWGMALVTASSIFAIFGAQEIVNAIVGYDAASGCGGHGHSKVSATIVGPIF